MITDFLWGWKWSLYVLARLLGLLVPAFLFLFLFLVILLMVAYGLSWPLRTDKFKAGK